MITHEQYISEVAKLATSIGAASGRLTGDDVSLLNSVKLTYGAGEDGVRGVTYYRLWQDQGKARPFVALCATCQSHAWQVVGTTLHELGHVLAGWPAGHGPEWKAACERLGLRRIKAAGTEYVPAMVEPGLREALERLQRPDEGEPVCALTGPKGVKIKPCGAGIGTRGGKSRGKGSGSRLRLWQCPCGCKARVSSDDFRALCLRCDGRFERPGV